MSHNSFTHFWSVTLLLLRLPVDLRQHDQHHGVLVVTEVGVVGDLQQALEQVWGQVEPGQVYSLSESKFEI